MKMRSGIKKRIAAGLMFLGILAISVSRADAADGMTTAQIPVEQHITVEQGRTAIDSFSFTYQLTSLKEGNPMPEGSSGGVYSFSLKGNEAHVIGPVTYDTAGIYEYRLEQVINTKQDYYTCDTEIYTIIVYVKNGNDNDILTQVIVVNSSGEKVDSPVRFENQYCPPSSGSQELMQGGTGVKTGDSGNFILWSVLLSIAIFSGMGFVLRRKDLRLDASVDDEQEGGR